MRQLNNITRTRLSSRHIGKLSAQLWLIGVVFLVVMTATACSANSTTDGSTIDTTSATTLVAPSTTASTAMAPTTTDVAITTRAEPAEVTFGVFENAGFAPAFLAESEGLFEAANLEVTLVPTRVPADAIPNLVGNQQQFAGLNLGTIAAAASQGFPIEIVAPTFYGGPANQIWVLSESPIQSLEDLEGATIGVGGLNTPAHAAIYEHLATVGLTPDDIEVILVPFADATSALRAGNVEAVQVVEPAATAAGDEIRPIIDDLFGSFGEEAVLGYYATNAEFAASNPEVVAAMKRALDQAAILAQENPDLVRQAIQDFSDMPAELAAGMPLPIFGTDLKIANAQQQVDRLASYGFLESSVDMQSLVFTNDG